MENKPKHIKYTLNETQLAVQNPFQIQHVGNYEFMNFIKLVQDRPLLVINGSVTPRNGRINR